ncbi:MAG TPA: hypothetical protein VJI98_02280 [Candidatus Nanoarchaeia archaeon]|nr:hypothetical protein [Candidatus Nanoarchaeia archaeon]
MKRLFLILIIVLLVGCGPVVVEETKEPELVPPQLEELVSPAVHTIKITETGFEPSAITIKTGDTVVWENVRSGRLNTALVVGTKQCVFIKSKLLKTGETFEKTFDEVDTCQFLDAVTNTQLVKVIIED